MGNNNVILGDDPDRLLDQLAVLDRMKRNDYKDNERMKAEEEERKRNITSTLTLVPRKEKRWFYRPLQATRVPEGAGEQFHLLHEDPALQQYMVRKLQENYINLKKIT